MDFETQINKSFDFKFETKAFEEKTVDGIKIGVIRGYASTYNNIDKGGDIFQKGAFVETIKEQKGTKLAMLKEHSTKDVLGGFPVDMMIDDEKGLFVEGHVNLGVEKGNEFYLLAKQGIINKMSIGFIDRGRDFVDGLRIIKKADLKEISVVLFPANEQADITEVKSIEEATELKDVEAFLKSKGLSQNERKSVISKVNALKEKNSEDEVKKQNQRDVEEEKKQRDVVKERKQYVSEIKNILTDYINKIEK